MPCCSWKPFQSNCHLIWIKVHIKIEAYSNCHVSHISHTRQSLQKRVRGMLAFTIHSVQHYNIYKIRPVWDLATQICWSFWVRCFMDQWLAICFEGQIQEKRKVMMKNTIGSEKVGFFGGVFFALKLQCVGYFVRNDDTWLLTHRRKIPYHMIPSCNSIVLWMSG